jgi:DNA-binding transcriptional ArsR family regulator
MKQVRYIEDVQQARALFKPLRLEVIRQLADPRTCNDLAEAFGVSPQNIYYHVKILERAGLVEKIAEQQVRGLMQGIYQASARSYWLSPRMIRQIGYRQRVTDEMSSTYLLGLAEQVYFEVGSLPEAQGETPTLAINAQIELANPDDRSAFLEELKGILKRLARKYGASSKDSPLSEIYRLMVASYPISGLREDT